MLMVNGKIIYFNDAAKAENYFKNIGYPVPNQSNPADYFMQMMSIENYEEEDTTDKHEIEMNHLKVVELHNEKIEKFSEEY